MADSSPRLRFRSAIDWWVSVVLGIPTLRFAWGYWQSLGNGRMPSVGLIVASVVFAGVWYCIVSTRYEIADDRLTVAWGPFRTHVPLGSIHTLRATRSIFSAPANSLDRIEVQSANHSPVVISPRDQQGFIAAIRERVPAVKVEGLA